MSGPALFFALLGVTLAASAMVAVVEAVVEWLRDRRD